jgi:hypothetical protein
MTKARLAAILAVALGVLRVVEQHRVCRIGRCGERDVDRDRGLGGDDRPERGRADQDGLGQVRVGEEVEDLLPGVPSTRSCVWSVSTVRSPPLHVREGELEHSPESG